MTIPVKFDPPRFTADDARALARSLYGLEATASEMPSERDRNFLLATAGGGRFVLKIAGEGDDPGLLDMQNQALRHIASRAPSLHLPEVRASLSGALLEAVTAPDGTRHLVRLLTYVPGRVLADVRPHSDELLASLGRVLGTIDRALLDFDHPAADRDLKWDLRRAGWIREYLPGVDDDARRALVQRLLDLFERDAAPRLASARSSVIYNDANDYNVIVGGDDPYEQRVTTVVDFGDMLRTCTVADVAIACAYGMLGKADPLRAAAAIVAGFHEVLPLDEDEIDLVYPLALARLCVSVVNSAYQRHAEPGNQYLTISEQPAWDLLERLDQVSPRLPRYALRSACGLPANPATPAIERWLSEHPQAPGPLLEPDPRGSTTRVLDLGLGSDEAGTPDLWDDPGRFTHELWGLMRRDGATIGVGRYDEVRAFYSSDIFRGVGNDGPDWRTVHLGLDLFVDAGTPVLAPFEGVVHSFATNDGPLDYGPTIILEHPAVGDRPAFYTLYGHLAPNSLNWMHEGRPVSRGSRIGEVGHSAVNGGWPPHLHFQVITDMLDRRGDFPGVARPRERGLWLGLSPDPNLVARIPAPTTAPREATAGEALAARAAHIGPSLSVSYRKPLKIVRGWLQFLYDADGRAYLDAVNNVPHVGHCHPHVVAAGRRQMAVLNTNTRYLHDHLGRYAGRLCAMLPAPLSVCYFVNSGSEANELALRLARARTSSRNTIVVDVAYHGNTTSLIEISPYKFDGPGGAGAPPHVRKVPTPDVYRGLHRGGADAGPRYAAHVADAIAAFAAEGGGVGAFIAESMLSCAGQVVLPEGYLREAYRLVREAGGVCIADEVQVGFGRVGTHTWAFETQGVVPDIVTMGKPIGNGHPLGAVVTTPEIAAAFSRGMEYFNTYGGNPVSCAIGMAVLDVIEREGLQEHARHEGARLLAGLRDVMARHPLVGDVRGLGLFAGVELVTDPETREPAGAEAAYVANRMRDLGVLVSTDGPHHNVLKIKPPMVFGGADVDALVNALDHVLGELPR